jgi:UDP-N-acetylglucosamine 2-epimerase (non-hydrolysing)
MPWKVLCVGGARPNFMKLAPLCAALAGEPLVSAVLVHTGQHYDDALSGCFFRELGLPEPAHHLHVGSGSHAQQTAEIMKRFEPVLVAEAPDLVVVVGDVNSTMACALVAAKLGVPVVHVEAGLRSFDRSMPEEINRLVTDAVADLLLVTETSARRNLLAEGIAGERIRMVGNLMVDTLRQNLEAARRAGAAGRFGVEAGKYGLVTLHRPANVDDSGALGEILGALEEIACELPLLWPVHPRTRAQLDGMAAPGARLRLLDPLGYTEFLSLLADCAVVLTDSGGVQEESTALGVPCLTLRKNTERPVTIEEGTNLLAGTSKSTILAAWAQMRLHPKAGRVPAYWDGQAARRCREAIIEFLRLRG